MDFKDQVVIVTGAGYGIGRAIALAFGRGGARLVLAARSRDKLDTVAAELRALNTQPLVVPVDVAREPDVSAMVRAALDFGGRIDVLVNNAGIGGPTALARDIPGEQWRACVDINLNGAFYCAKYAVPAMMAARRGSIVNISSVAGRIGFPLRSPYAASKWGLIGLSHSLAAELGPYGIRVNAVLPGPVEGERYKRQMRERAHVEGRTYEQLMTASVAAIPLGRMPTEEDVADLTVFLASPAAASISGQAIHVDGGYRMQ